MNEMRRRAEIVLQLGVGLDRRQGCRRAAIAVVEDYFDPRTKLGIVFSSLL